MAVSAVGNSATGNNGNATVAVASGLTIPFDKTGLQANDVVALIVTYGNAGNTFAVPTGNGGGATFVLGKSQANTTTLSGAIFLCRITQGMLDDATLTQFNVPTNVEAIDMQWARRQFRGVDTTTLLSGTAVSAFSATFDTGCTLPQIASVVDGAYIVSSMHARNNGTATATTLSGTASGSNPTSLSETAHVEGKTAASSSLRALSVYEGTRSGAGSAGSWATTASQAVAEVGISIALNPAAGAPTPTVAQFESGAATDTTAKVTAKLGNVTTSSVVRAVFATNSGLSTGVVNGTTVNPTSEGRVILTVSGLTADTAYFYGIEVDGTLIASPAGRGEIVTNPTPGTPETYDVALGSCFGAESSFALGAHIAGLSPRPRKMVVLGDGGYFDRFTGTVAQYRGDWDTVAQIANYQTLAKTMCIEHIPSDHDYLGDNTGGPEGGYQEVSQAWRETRVLRTLAEAAATDGVEQTPYQIGRVWHCLWDTRRFRSPEGNTDNSSKTLLGSAQKARLKAHALANPLDLKVWYFDCPWIGATQAGEDHWGLYQTERTEIVDYLSANSIKNVVIVCGDMHSVASDDGRNSPGGIPVFQAAPLDREGTVKGGPYQYGPEPGVQAPFQQRYGWMRVTDAGGLKLRVEYEGRNSSGVATITRQQLDFFVQQYETLRPTATRNVSAAFNPNADPPAAAALAEDPDTSTLTDPLTLANPSGSPTNLSNVYPNARVAATGQTGFAWATGGAANVTDTSDTTLSTEASASTTLADYFSFAAGAFSAIPAGSVVNGISAVIKHRAGTANRLTPFLQLGTANGTLIGGEVNASTNVVGGAGTLATTAGGITNTVNVFGAVPTLAQLQTSGAAGFGVRLRITRSNATTYDLYSIKVTVTYTPPGSTVNTKAEVLLDDPVGALATGVGTGEIRVAVNKKGSGANPTFRAEIHENASATVLATPIPDTTISVSGSVTLLSGVFDQSVLTNKNNAEVWLIGTGAAGGAVEFDAVEWNGQTIAGIVFNRAPADSIAVADGASRVAAYVRSEPDAIAVADTPSRVASYARSKSDAFAVADAASRIIGYARAAADAIVVADTPSRVMQHTRSKSDAIAVADTPSRIASYARAAADAIVVADTPSRVASYVRSEPDAIAVADTPSRSVFQLLSRLVSDAIAVADTPSRAAAYQRAASDATIVTDASGRTVGYQRSKSDSIAVADVLTPSLLRIVARSIPDAIVLADQTQRTVAYARSQIDAIAVADTPSRTISGQITRTVADAIVVADLAARTASVARSKSDAIVVADAASRIASSLRSAFDAIAVLDNASRTVIGVLARQVTDAIAVTDQAQRSVAYARSKVDSIALADAASRLLAGTIFRVKSDAIAVADSKTVFVGFIAGVKPNVVVEMLNVPSASVQVLGIPDGSLVFLEVPSAVAEMLRTSDAGVEILDVPSATVEETE